MNKEQDLKAYEEAERIRARTHATAKEQFERGKIYLIDDEPLELKRSWFDRNGHRLRDVFYGALLTWGVVIPCLVGYLVIITACLEYFRP